ncbi:hypothetical protein [Burkholderia puraquae]|uniref:hypothetical protein n=1 Tax=Burkholderia puraquae TaxID=1904757 RepID=UPI00158375F0
MKVSPVDSSCCGTAGSFGDEAEHDDASQAKAERSLRPALHARAESAIVVAGGAQTQAVHVAKMPARALRN